LILVGQWCFAVDQLLATNHYFIMTNYVILAGGVGGAKLVDGFAQILSPDELTIIGNTGDDFVHMGLTICPDLDTVMHTLAGVDNRKTGWGRVDESWRTMAAVKQLGGPDWFNLGDLDLGTHLTRTHLLNEGMSLTEVVGHLCRHFKIKHTLLPMSDHPTPTQIETEDGILPFQEWFVKAQWQPVATQVILPENAKATNAVAKALQNADVVILAPSNPFVSIDPILNTYPIRALVEDMPAFVAAVSPIISGAAIKGPAAKMMAERGMPVTASAIAEYYGDLIDLFVYDVTDTEAFQANVSHQVALQTWMKTSEDRVRLAEDILATIQKLM
jgi:LPPG:FO 2-phospho-L-lactate transferase